VREGPAEGREGTKEEDERREESYLPGGREVKE